MSVQPADPGDLRDLQADFLAVFLSVPNAVLNGSVHIRDWREEKCQKGKHPEAKRTLLSGAFKTRLCWFFTHHPDGCALPSHCCPFAHGPEELRPPRRKRRSCELPPPCEGPAERQAPAPRGCMVSETFPFSSPPPSMGT